MREPRSRRSVRSCNQQPTMTGRGRQWRRRPSNSTPDAKLVLEHLTCSDEASSSPQAPVKVTGFTGTTSIFSEDEEDLLLKLHALLGNRWSLIAGRLPGRTGEEAEAHWDSLVIRMKLKGIDHVNHRVELHASLDSHDEHGEQRQSVVQNQLGEHLCHLSSSKDGGDAASDDCAVSDAWSTSHR